MIFACQTKVLSESFSSSCLISLFYAIANFSFLSIFFLIHSMISLHGAVCCSVQLWQSSFSASSLHSGWLFRPRYVAGHNLQILLSTPNQHPNLLGVSAIHTIHQVIGIDPLITPHISVQNSFLLIPNSAAGKQFGI